MPRKPRQSRSQHLAESVLTAAEELLTKDNPLSVSALAKRAGVGVASIYDYFSNKATVVDAVVDRLTIRNAEAFARELEEHQHLSVDALIDRFAQRFVDIYLDPSRSRLMSRVVVLVFRRGDLALHLEHRDRIAGLLANRVREQWPTLTAEEANRTLRSICDVAMGLLIAEVVRGDPDPDEVRALMARITRLELHRLEQLHAARTA